MSHETVCNIAVIGSYILAGWLVLSIVSLIIGIKNSEWRK